MKRTKSAPARAGGTSNNAAVQPPEATDQKGDLLIRDLWQQGTDSVHDMRAVNTATPRRRTKDPAKFLNEAERGENGCTWRIASRSAGTSPPFSSWWMD